MDCAYMYGAQFIQSASVVFHQNVKYSKQESIVDQNPYSSEMLQLRKLWFVVSDKVIVATSPIACPPLIGDTA